MPNPRRLCMCMHAQEAAALKDLQAKAGQKGAFGGAGLKKSGKK